jgi:hypothetical protein
MATKTQRTFEDSGLVPRAQIPTGPIGEEKQRHGETAKPNALMTLGGELFQDFFQSIVDQLEATAGLDESQNAELATYLQTTNKDIVEKRDRLGEFICAVDGYADAIRAEERRLALRRSKFEKISNCFRNSIHQQMLESGVKKVEGKLFSLAIQKNPSSVEIVSEAEVPPEFVSYEPRIDKRAIKDALEAGKEVPGAKLIDDKTRLVIR